MLTLEYFGIAAGLVALGWQLHGTYRRLMVKVVLARFAERGMGDPVTPMTEHLVDELNRREAIRDEWRGAS